MQDSVMQEIRRLEQQVEQVGKNVSEVGKNVETIKQLISGNPLDKDDKGMVGIQNDHEQRLTKLERFKDRVFWTVAGFGFGGAGIFELLKKFIER